tara:strand:+ start:104 stop:265 length:162 start_codon:yes stop_codon:yes gene_type:complete
MTHLTVDQKRIIGLLIKEFCGINTIKKVMVAYEAPMEPLNDDIYQALLDEQDT